jgi:hypothetical protein
MKETIISINEDGFTKPSRFEWSSGEGFDGLNIVTSDQTIQIGVSNFGQCCERWGCFFTTDDNPQDFIGACVLGISITDTCLSTKKIDDLEGEETSVMFVNIDTNLGRLQYACYNSHNGYYGHEAVVISKQLNHATNL